MNWIVVVRTRQERGHNYVSSGNTCIYMKHTSASGGTRSNNDKQITILCPLTVPESCLVSHKHPRHQTMEVVKMTTEIDQTIAHHLPQPRVMGHDGRGGVVTEPDCGICFLRWLRENNNKLKSLKFEKSKDENDSEVGGEMSMKIVVMMMVQFIFHFLSA